MALIIGVENYLLLLEKRSNPCFRGVQLPLFENRRYSTWFLRFRLFLNKVGKGILLFASTWAANCVRPISIAKMPGRDLERKLLGPRAIWALFSGSLVNLAPCLLTWVGSRLVAPLSGQWRWPLLIIRLLPNKPDPSTAFQLDRSTHHRGPSIIIFQSLAQMLFQFTPNHITCIME